MARLSVTLLLLFLGNCAWSQKGKSIEISILGRYDRHAHYVSNFAGRAYNDTTRLYGTSYGIHGGYRKQVGKNYSVYLGLGYYQLRIDRIKASMPFGIRGVRRSRNIDNGDDDSTMLLYSTSKYHYNNLALTLSLSRILKLDETTHLEVGVEGLAYQNISQQYVLFRNYTYKTAAPRKMEFGANITMGLMKQRSRYYYGPSLILPVFQNLKGDPAFFERPHMNIPKWFHGVGLSARIGRYI